ncbi:MAG: serine/threonine protein kinase [Myxococcales bacterium]|nr:serine/threonine protein kinase [Myxococcales bacterium]
MTARYPRRFGKYLLLKPLAKGGMGEIYVAAGGEIGGFEKLCVIKKVIAEKADRSKSIRFLDEAKVVLRLSHSCLVTTFDAGEVEGEFYIAMELVEGKDLRDVWNRCVRTRQRIPLDVALHVVREVARALSYVHAYGKLKLVHRDVAPPNILLAYVGDVKLTDFGLARSVLKQEQTAPGVVYGRAAYLAPEQARGEVADARTDVYTLGIVLWELLTGQQFLQISGLDPATALAIVRHPQLVKPSTRASWITQELDDVVLTALAPDREKRFQSADEMRKALGDVIASIAPRSGADRISEFIEGIYADVIAQEREERERFLQDVIPTFRGRPETRPVPPPPRPAPPAAAPASAGEDSATLPRVRVGRTDSEVPARKRPSAARPAAAPARKGLGGVPLPGLPPSPPPGAGNAARGHGDLRRSDPSSIEGAVESRHASEDPSRAFSRGFVGRMLGGRYRVIESIGEGGMGQVFAAEHIEIGKRVAVKVLQPACSGRPDLVERFRLEARAASKIGHPNIVDVTDLGTTEEGLVYYVMEQLQGVDLAEVLAQERTVEPARAVQITIQMCQALQAAHQADIIHRDLKPENIFLQPGGPQGDRVKIIDFGLARSLEASAVGQNGRPLTNPGTPIGTPEYMAPEQADGHPADARSDIYAVGAILYEMVTGYPAFAGRGYADVLVKKTREKPRSPRELRPEMSKELEDVVMWALDRDPGRRPQSMAQLEYALTKIARGRGQAVAALLGIEAGEGPTPPPNVVTPQPLAGLPPRRKEAVPRPRAEVERGGGNLLDVGDLTVPAATLFPEFAEPGAGVTVEEFPPVAPFESAASLPPVPRAASFAERSGSPPGPALHGLLAAPSVGQAFLARHGIHPHQEASKALVWKKVALGGAAALALALLFKLLVG